MHVTLSRYETPQNFNLWVYGEERLSEDRLSVSRALKRPIIS